MAKNHAVDPLTKPEKKLFQRCETVIKKGMQTFVDVGHALLQIQEQQLYREAHTTFEEYCKDRWQFSRSHAYRLIESAKVVEDVSSPDDDEAPTPMTESQARPLAKIKDPETRKKIWDDAVQNAPTGKVTAKIVEEAVKRHEETAPPADVVESEVVQEDEEFDIPKLFIDNDQGGLASWSWPVITIEDLRVLHHTKRVDGPRHTTPPRNSDDPEDKTVLVCPGVDLFESRVKQPWVEEMLTVMGEVDRWTYLIITRNYSKVSNYAYPPNVWLGAAISTNDELVRAEKAFAGLVVDLKFIYGELREVLELTEDTPFEWLTISAGTSLPSAGILGTTYKAQECGLPVFWDQRLHIQQADWP